MSDHYTEEGTGFVLAGPNEIEEARKRHHLATADPDLEGTMTGPAHEKKYGLERAAESEQRWRDVGVHPFENGTLVGDEPGAENVRGVSNDIETADAPRASDSK